jgi:hypothetical protein
MNTAVGRKTRDFIEKSMLQKIMEAKCSASQEVCYLSAREFITVMLHLSELEPPLNTSFI